MSHRFNRRSAPAPEEPVFDLGATLALYSVTTVVGAHPRPTGLPARLAAVPAPAPATAESPPPDPGQAAVAAETPTPAAIVLAERESIALELLDVDGTAYLFRAVVVATGDEVHVLVPVAERSHLVGGDALAGASQVVAVVHRNDESWILTAQIRGQEWSEAGVTISLSIPQHALSVPRRVHERVALRARVAFEARVEVARADVVDISAAGASVRVEGAGMPPVDPFEVVVLMPEPITVHAMVINSRLDHHAPGSQIWHLQFVAVTPQALHRLTALSGALARR